MEKKTKNPLITQAAIDLLNFRIEKELSSAYLYQAMSLYLQDMGMINAAKLWDKFYHEEQKHAQWAVDYLISLNQIPILEDIEASDQKFDGFADVVEKTLQHEILVSHQCNELAIKAIEMKDPMLLSLAQKYNDEQIDELNKSFDLRSISKLSQDMLVIDNYIGENFLG